VGVLRFDFTFLPLGLTAAFRSTRDITRATVSVKCVSAQLVCALVKSGAGLRCSKHYALACP
jgi:hypothetical protein